MLRTSVGVLEVLAVDRVPLSAITAADAYRAGAASRAALLTELNQKGREGGRSGRADRTGFPVHRVELRFAGEDPRAALRADAQLDAGAIAALRARLERLDAASRRGPWTRATLAAIAAHPEVRAPDLAAGFGLETVVFKRDVRKLKELGLTESLSVGYRISPRGARLLESLPS